MIQRIKNKMQNVPEGVKASIAYTVCSVLQRCLSLITMPLFTRILTTEQYGQFSIYQSWSAILTLFITLNLAFGSFSTAMVKFEDDRKGYVAAVQNIAVALTAAFFVLYLPFRGYWNQWFELPTPMVCLMVVEILMNFAMACWYALQRFTYRYKRVVAVTLLMTILSPIAAYILVVNSQERGYARIVGCAAVNILFGACIFVYASIAGKGGWNKKYWKYALSFNIPLIPYYLSQVVFNQSDRIMISHICGTDKAGMYGVAYTLGTILLFVMNAINNSYVPWFYNKIKQGRGEENKKMATGIALLLSFLLLGVIALAPEVILILAGEPYYDAIWVVPPVTMSLLLLFYSQLFINVEFYYEEKKMLVWGSIGAALLNIVLNAWLIPVFGFVIAGYTTLASYVVFALSNYFTMKYVCKKNHFLCNFYDIKNLILICVVFSALSMVAMSLYRHLSIRYCIIVLVLLTLAIFYKKVIVFVKYVISGK